jgi:two-component system NtrC family sensor kinase
MHRRQVISLLATSAWPLAARAQQSDQVLALQMRILRLQAEAAADKIGQFIREIESQVGWTTQLPWSAGTLDQRRFDGLRLLRQVPAIAELAQLDSTGKEQLRVSRISMVAVASQSDISSDPRFAEAVTKKVYYGPVYFLHPAGPFKPGDPYMRLSLAGARRDAGVSVVLVNLKLIQDLVAKLKVGERGAAYVLDAEDRVIAHRDISLVQRDFSTLAQVQAARAASFDVPPQTARDIKGREVLVAYAAVVGPGWPVFVELPADDADAAAR